MTATSEPDARPARPAPAKINLALAVDPPDPSGLHPIATWAVAVDLVDDVSAGASSNPAAHEPPEPTLSLSRSLASDAPLAFDLDWPAEHDLAHRARVALQDHLGRPLPGRLHIHKRIPPGGGLGGGSSDAAATVALLNQTHRLGLSDAELDHIAEPLGADVPLCASLARTGGARLASGYGEQLAPAPLPPWSRLILLLCAHATPTGPVYQAFDAQTPATRTPGESAESRIQTIIEQTLATGRLTRANDLEPAARKVQPAVDRALTALRHAGHDAHMTGSGSSLFLPRPDDDAPASTRLRDLASLAGPGWVAVQTTILPPSGTAD
ncbi:MAG: hypothetical protein AAF288_14075 [Planctomycetota bacterium]